MKKQAISSASSPSVSSFKKRDFKADAVKKWITDDLAKGKAEMWLNFISDDNDDIICLKCRLCAKHEKGLRSTKYFSDAVILGSNNLKLSC